MFSDITLDAVAVLIGDYSSIRKKAAILYLKTVFPKAFVTFLLDDKRLYPCERNDARVRHWTQAVLSKGKCECCGSTENLEAHHILHWSDYPPGRIDVKNGQCLCHQCHTNEHYGEKVYALMKR